MDGQKKQKLGVAVILDREILSCEVLKNKSFEIKTFEPFNKLSINFLIDFSKELRRSKKINLFPDLIYLIFWCNKNKNLSKNYKSNNLRLGRGIVFHICPSNVPTNFIYSFFFGLLSGNSNIVKIPSQDFEEKKIILSTIKTLFDSKKYKDLKKSNCFIQYSDNDKITEKISSICDARVIWGGNKTVNNIRKIWMPERAIDLTFPDRYSLSVISIEKLNKKKPNQIKQLVKNFYNDGYTMNQLACNSPHFIFWVGKKNIKLQNYFWKQLNQIVEKKFNFDDVHIVDKYSNLIENIIIQNNFNNIKMYKNNIYVVDANNKTKQIEDIRGVNGTFFQKNLKKINNLKNYINKKCQTVSYFGFNKIEIKNFLLKNNLSGPDRIVPIGKALEIDLVWDGYDVIGSLSRVISIE